MTIMTNNEIVEQVSGDVKSIIENMCVKDEHKDDLFEEIILILLTYDNGKLFQAYRNSQIKFFIARVICNQYYSTHSYFYKTYKKWEDNKYDLIEGYKRLDGQAN